MAKQRYGINDAYRGTVGTVIGYEWRGRWCLRARPLRVHNPRTAKQQANRSLFKQMVALAGSMKVALRKGLRKRSLEQHMTECNQFVKYNKERFALDTLLSQPSRAASSPNLGEQQGEQRMIVDWENLIISEGSVAVPVFTLLSQPQAAASSPGHTPSPLRGTPPSLGGEQLPQSGLTGSPSLPGSAGDMACDRSGAKLGEGDRRSAVVEECVKDGGVCISIPFLPHAEGERASGDDEVYLYAYCPEAGEGVLSAPAYRKSGSVQLTLPERWQGKEVHLYGFAVDYRGEASGTAYIGCLESTPIKTQRAEPLQINTSINHWQKGATESPGIQSHISVEKSQHRSAAPNSEIRKYPRVLSPLIGLT